MRAGLTINTSAEEKICALQSISPHPMRNGPPAKRRRGIELMAPTSMDLRSWISTSIQKTLAAGPLPTSAERNRDDGGAHDIGIHLTRKTLAAAPLPRAIRPRLIEAVI